MSVVNEVIRLEEDNSLSFGDYSVKEKKKVEGFEALGDLYKVKTHESVTRLEKNGNLLLETVPGAAVFSFKATENRVLFAAEGFGDTQFTMELESDKEYKIYIDDVNIGNMKSNVGGKITFSIGLGQVAQRVKIEKA